MLIFFKKIGLFFVSLYIWTVLFDMAFIILITGLLLLFVSNARVVFRTVRAMLKFMFKIMFVKVEVEHPKDFDFDQSYIIMPNHITFWDIPVICSVLPNYTFGIEAESHFSWPIYGFFIRKYGTLPINRKNILASFRTFETAAKNMKEKRSSFSPKDTAPTMARFRSSRRYHSRWRRLSKCQSCPAARRVWARWLPKVFSSRPVASR